MLEGLEPSISLTGGPWYTDNELDTEFIQHLMDACYKFIRDLVRRCLACSFSSPAPSLILLLVRASRSARKVVKMRCTQFLTRLNIPPPTISETR